MIVRLEPADGGATSAGGQRARPAGSTGDGGAQGQDEGHKSRPQPTHLS